MEFDVKYIAKLAKLKIKDNEIDKFSKQMKEIVEMVDSLPQLDDDLESIDKDMVMELRKDEIGKSLSTENATKNCPQVECGCFCVPKVVD